MQDSPFLLILISGTCVLAGLWLWVTTPSQSPRPQLPPDHSAAALPVLNLAPGRGSAGDEIRARLAAGGLEFTRFQTLAAQPVAGGVKILRPSFDAFMPSLQDVPRLLETVERDLPPSRWRTLEISRDPRRPDVRIEGQLDVLARMEKL